MIRRSRGVRYSATSGTAGSDTDALQTDVMRFMAILGLCLMALFALVQSASVQEPHPPRQQPGQGQLPQAIEREQARVLDLEAELARLTAGINAAQLRHTRSRQALAVAQDQLTRVTDQTRQARADRDRLTVELMSLNRQLAQQRKDLAGIQQASHEKTHSLQALERQLKDERQQLDDISHRLSALGEAAARTPAVINIPPAPAAKPAAKPATKPAAKPAAKPVAKPAAKPEKQGFTLRFASNAALDRLVAAETVSLYGMMDRQAWRLSLADDQPLVAGETFPGWFHEMAPATVPEKYVQALAAIPGGPGRVGVVWGVQLPATIRQDITSLSRGQRGGTLVILASGQVRLEGE
jgi:uncharacterized protein YlxW (UPF0749 family)